MRASQLPLFTRKDAPKDASAVSHVLLERAGFIRKISAGLYAYLPFAVRVHRKIEAIVREEMDAAGGVEVNLPVITPAELWEKSGRWNSMGKEMMRMQDRHDVSYALGPTHEESITWLAGTFLQSYRQLPVNLYQIGNKYRDEIRPRFGLIRGREFVMKDAYSFHLDSASLDETYQKMRTAYRNIFNRCGLKTIPVQADSGSMGGSGSEEFMVASAIGEETLLICHDETCGYSSNSEKTPYVSTTENVQATAEMSEVHTPGISTIADVAAFFSANAADCVKAIVLENETHVVMAFIPGDRELNQIKLQNTTGTSDLLPATAGTIQHFTGAEPGYTGPSSAQTSREQSVSEKRVLRVIDKSLKGRSNLISGANKSGYHLTGVCEGRDFEASDSDVIQAGEGDTCPQCLRSTLYATRGIEVGHIFKLGDKYTRSLGITVLDENGRPQTPIMGCYGIGVGRTMATIVEQSHDEAGIIWPLSVAPFQIVLIPVLKEENMFRANDLYARLCQAGLDVYFDDRKERPGVKFNDADLTGIPIQIVIGASFEADGLLEVKDRKSGSREKIPTDEFISRYQNV